MNNLMQCDCKKNSLKNYFLIQVDQKRKKFKIKKNINVNIMNVKIANIYSPNYTLI